MSDATFTRAATAADAGRALRQAVNAAARAAEGVALCVRDGFAFTRADLAGFRSQLAELRASVDAIEARIMPGAPLLAPDAPAGAHVLSEAATRCGLCADLPPGDCQCGGCVLCDPPHGVSQAPGICARCRRDMPNGTMWARGVDGLWRHEACDAADRADRAKA